ncbi:MAG: sigma-70 family RNA polymerase sigma factor [Verrucomicrobiota bacterium]
MDSPHTQQVLQLFVRHQPRLRGFIFALLPDFVAAEDVLQETFLVTQRKAEEFDLASNFLAWVFRIARFQVMKAQTAHQRNALRMSEEVLDTLAASAPDEPWDDRRLALLPLCLAKLAPQARRTVDLFYRDELKPNEIARLLSWTPAAVSVALSRARKTLRECIDRRIESQTPAIS